MRSTTAVSSSRSDEVKQVMWWSSDVQWKPVLSVVKYVSFIQSKYGSEADKVVKTFSSSITSDDYTWRNVMVCCGQAMPGGEQSCVRSRTAVSSSRSDEAKQVKWWSSDVQWKAVLSVVTYVSFIQSKY